jgi:hypothetical protein
MMKYKEIEKLANERKETEIKLREQVDKKIKMLMDAGYAKQQAYRMLVGKVVDFRTLMRWHEGDTMRPFIIDKLKGLVEKDGQD